MMHLTYFHFTHLYFISVNFYIAVTLNTEVTDRLFTVQAVHNDSRDWLMVQIDGRDQIDGTDISQWIIRLFNIEVQTVNYN